MDLRIAEEQHAEGIARVHIDTWKECYKGIVPDSYLDALDYEEKSKGWAKGLAEGSEPGFVAVVDEEIVGWVTFGKNRDQRSEDIYEIYGIYVLPDLWGTKIGFNLFEAAIKDILEHTPTCITLWVLKANTRAQEFYLKNGFKPDGTIQQINIGGKSLDEVRYERKSS